MTIVRHQYFTLFILGLLFCNPVFSQSEVPRLKFEELDKYLHQDNDTTYVVNFWATWCAPCVKELPYFEDANKTEFQKPVKVILVSLDLSDHYETKLIPFITEHGIKSQVLFLDDGKAHIWIPKVDPAWSGAIPATLIYKGNTRQFFEEALSKEELYSAIEDVSSE